MKSKIQYIINDKESLMCAWHWKKFSIIWMDTTEWTNESKLKNSQLIRSNVEDFLMAFIDYHATLCHEILQCATVSKEYYLIISCCLHEAILRKWAIYRKCTTIIHLFTCHLCLFLLCWSIIERSLF